MKSVVQKTLNTSQNHDACRYCLYHHNAVINARRCERPRKPALTNSQSSTLTFH